MGILTPKRMYHRITDINPNELVEMGIKLLLCDVDNTLAFDSSQQPLEKLDNWIRKVKRKGLSVILFSNAKEDRVKPFAKTVDLDYVFKGQKPLPFKILSCVRKLNLKPKQAAIVGDQLLTDILGSKLSGITGILVTPISPEKSRRFKLKRKIENIYFKLHKIERK